MSIISVDIFPQEPVMPGVLIIEALAQVGCGMYLKL